ncbi:MAG: VWA domain-containing protein [Clostridia bacterium]|nr:VWA domain-containing protein [Clostridia bacterium]
MTKIKKLSKKTLAVILSVMVVMVSLPLMLIPILAADSNDPRVVDPSTHNSWQQLFPADNTTQSGRIWTDKSVFKNGNAFTGLVDAAGNNFNLSMLDKDNNFLVALSALASNKSILGYSYTPTDTMLVLDISASMSNSGYVDELVTSANNAISRLLNLNKHNRVGVILYSDSANGTVLLPIDRYTAPTSGANSGKFINNYGQNYIQVVNGVRNGDKDLMDDDWVSVEGGTYLQSGIYTAMSEFLKQTETVIPDGEHQAGTARTPIFVVMSDGRVTYGTNNFAAQNNSNYQTGLRGSNIGNGTTNQRDETFVAMDFVSQLTAAYAKYKVDEHYNGAEPLFYTLGLGGSGSSLNSAPLNPSAHNSTDHLWENYLDTTNDSSLFVSLGGNNNYTSVKKIAEISDINQLDYVEKFFPATNAEGLIKAFDEIVKQIIIQSLYYPTLVDNGSHDHDGFVEFIDDIGHYMDVKDIKGIMLGNQFFTGEYLAQNFTEDDSVFFNPDGTYSDLGNNLVWSVKERIGISDVAVARDLINSAYNTYQLRSWNGGWSNYIGWYADENGNFMGHWHEGHTEADIPEVNGVKAAYINKSYGMLGAITGEYTSTDLMYISTQVHTRISDGNVSVIWRVPASLIPVITYDISLDGETLEDAENVQIEYKAAEPIRLIFEVGLDDDITPVNVSNIVKDKEAHIIDENNDGISDDGKYYFYTNWWSDDNLTHENPSKTEDTIVLFEPSVQNERYYYAEDTPVYINTGTDQNPNYQLYKNASMPTASDGNTYFRKYAVFKGKGTYTDGKENADIVWYYEEMSDATIGALTSECRQSDNSWDIPAGTVHRVLEPYNLPKAENSTASLQYVRYPVIDENLADHTFYIGSILGNNGRISVDIPQGIKLTKTVDDTLFGTTETFTFELESNISQLEDATLYHEDTAGKLTEIDPDMNGDKLIVKLKAGESVYVLDLKSGSVVAVTEKINGDYKVSKLTVNDSLLPVASDNMNTTIVADSLTRIEFENTLVVNDGTIVVSKEVNHDSNITYNSDHEFTFEVYPVGDYDARQTFKIKAGESYTLTGLAPGDYIVNEIEAELPDGFAPQQNLVTVTADNNIVATAHFINDYTPDAIKPALVVSGTKTLNGRAWQSGDEFEFAIEMLDGANWVSVTKNGATRTVKFGDAAYDYKFDFVNDTDLADFEFNKVGTYWFRVREVIPDNKLGGMTYDEIVRYFSVTVTDATMDGKLEVSVVNANAPATVRHANNIYTVDVDFTNIYAPVGSDELIVSIDKTVTDNAGTGKGKEGYIFGLFTAEGTEPIVTSQPTDANGKTNIDLSFPATVVGKEYNFVIKEIVPEDKLLGMTYDPTAYAITIKIVDNLDGTVTAFVEYDNTTTEGVSFSFTNVYKPAAAEVLIEGNKILDGRDLKANEFTFELYEGNTIKDDVTNAANGDFAFEKITFDRIGTYNYTVKEKKGNLGGIDYDTKVYAVKIVVSDDANNDGVLDYEVFVDNVKTTNIKNDIKFVNVYTTEDASVTFKATKKLTGRDLVNGEFKFDLYSAKSDFTLDKLIDDNIPAFKKDASTGIVTFTAQTFGAVGTYRFVILEDEVNGEGITVDTHKYQIEVVVTDNGTGKLVAEIKVDGTAVTGNIEDTVVFNNKYNVEPIDVTIEAFKTLSGKNLTANEFTFALFENGVQKATAKNGADGKVVFDKITYTKAGTYNYTVKEIKGNSKYITYDTKEYTVTVTIEDKEGKGYFTKTVAYALGGNTVEKAEFNNVYTPDDAEIIISAKKELDGRDIKNGEFTFELYKEGTLIDTKKNNSNGMVIFDALKFDAKGTYNYTVKEVKGNLGGVTYSTKVYAIKVVVSEDANLDGYYDYKLYVDNTETAIADIASKVVFENVYTAKEVKVNLKATKKLSGRDLIDGEFKFDLWEAGPNFAQIKVLDDNFKLVKVDNATGTITFSELTFNKVGNYYFVIVEDELDGKGITTDKHKFQIEVIVTDNGEGQLLAEVKVDGRTVSGKLEDAIVFNNAYTVDPTDIVIEAEKDLTGAELKGDDFTFQLFDKDGNLIESVKNDKDGKVTFSKLNITEAGTYVYTIKELNGNAKGITYDATEYTVTVNVKDGGKGLFEVEIIYSNAEGEVDKAVFENTYTPHISQTNDSTNAIAWFMLMIISGGLALALAVFRKKQNA